MASKTIIYNLHKIDLADSPPDITVLNPNFDIIDSQLNTLSEGKVDKVSGKQLSTNDYTTTEKSKLAGIATGANNTTINNTLTSTSTTSALSAAQGKVLKDLVDTKANDANLTSLQQTVTQHLDDFNAMRTSMKKRLTATQSSSQSIASAIDTTIIFNNAIENDLNYFTLHSNGTVTVNKNCTLVVRATIAVYPNALNGYIRLNLLKNNQYLVPSAQIDSLSNYSKSLLTTFEIDCVAGDNLAVQVYQQNSTSTPISTDTSNWFTKLQLGVKL